MAGHKGYGLAVLVEVLTAVLTGAAITRQVKSWVLDIPEPTNEGHAFIAIDIAAIDTLPLFGERMDGLVHEIREAPKAKGAERIYLPARWSGNGVKLRWPRGWSCRPMFWKVCGIGGGCGGRPGSFNLVF